MDFLELQPGFNPAVKIKDIDQEKIGASGANQSKGTSTLNDPSDSMRPVSSQSTAHRCEKNQSAEGDSFDLAGFAAMEEQATSVDKPVKGRDKMCIVYNLYAKANFYIIKFLFLYFLAFIL